MLSFHKTLIIALSFVQFVCLQPALPATESHTAFHQALETQDYYETPRGDLLRYTCFKSPIEGPKDTILFLQGRGTFLEFYEALVVPLLDRGFDVWMYDLSGQGGSSRLMEPEYYDDDTVQFMQHVDSFQIYIDDATDFIQDIVVPNSRGKLILGGYSTGAHVALRYLQSYPNHPFTSSFFISPLLALKAPVGNKAMSYLIWCASLLISLDDYRPNAGKDDPIFNAPFEDNVYTSDRNSYEEMKELCIQYRHLVMGGVSVGWVKAAVDSVDKLWNNNAIKAIKIPTLIATGGDDQMIEVKYNGEFSKRLALSEVVYYPSGRHELFRETPEIRAQWWTDFDRFFTPQTSLELN